MTNSSQIPSSNMLIMQGIFKALIIIGIATLAGLSIYLFKPAAPSTISSNCVAPAGPWYTTVVNGKGIDPQAYALQSMRTATDHYIDNMKVIDQYGVVTGDSKYDAYFAVDNVKTTSVGQWGQYRVWYTTLFDIMHRSVVISDCSGAFHVVYAEFDSGENSLYSINKIFAEDISGTYDAGYRKNTLARFDGLEQTLVPTIVTVDSEPLLQVKTFVGGNSCYISANYFAIDPIAGSIRELPRTDPRVQKAIKLDQATSNTESAISIGC